METITSRNNEKIKYACSLKESKFRLKESAVLIEGLRLCRDAALNNADIKSCFLCEEQYYSGKADIIVSAAEKVYIIEEHIAEKLSDTKSTQQIFCVCAMPDTPKEFNNGGAYVLLEKIRNPGNLGTILRTAEAFGLSGAVLCGCCDVYSPKVMRAAMGAVFRFPLFKAENEAEFIAEKKSAGMKFYCTVVDENAADIKSASFSGGTFVAVGNEGEGLESETIKLGESITIHMKGRAESLNAAQAATVIMYEMMNKNE